MFLFISNCIKYIGFRKKKTHSLDIANKKYNLQVRRNSHIFPFLYIRVEILHYKNSRSNAHICFLQVHVGVHVSLLNRSGDNVTIPVHGVNKRINNRY